MKNFKIGIQLFSVRDALNADFEGTIKAIADMGYDCVEAAGYCGKSADEFRAVLDKYNLTCPSVHQNLDFYYEGGKDSVEFVKTLGAKYSAIPWYFKEKLPGTDEWAASKEYIIKGCTILKENGVQPLYHNHDFEFTKVKGIYRHDLMMKEMPKDLLYPEFDTCWVHYAGVDPVEYILKYKGKVPVVHLKDFVCKQLAGGPAYDLIDENGNPMQVPSRADNEFRFVPLGKGRQDFPKIIEACREAGTEYLIVEQDQWYDGDALADAKASIDYLRTII